MDTMHSESVPIVTRWKSWQKLLFRFGSVYFVLYIYSFILFGIIWVPVVNWFAATFLNIDLTLIPPSGSGDTSFNYIHLLCLVIISVTAGMVWSIVDRKRPSYNEALAWVITLLRYGLIFYLFVYGAMKLALLQFPSPSLSRLIQPYGASSPMGLAWTFIGSSPAFTFISGVLEMTGALLLMFRRTVAFGSLFSMTVLANVAIMNLCYDIPVKIFSIHLFLISACIALPNARQLWNFFFTDKAVDKLRYPPTLPQNHLARIILKILVAAYLFIILLPGYLNGNKSYLQKTPLYGLYEATTFIYEGDTLPPLITDSIRWRYLIVDKGSRGTIKTMNDSSTRYQLKIDTVAKTVQFKNSDGSTYLKYELPSKDSLVLTGTFFDKELFIIFKRYDEKDFLLINRGFHWLNEYPYNK